MVRSIGNLEKHGIQRMEWPVYSLGINILELALDATGSRMAECNTSPRSKKDFT